MTVLRGGSSERLRTWEEVRAEFERRQGLRRWRTWNAVRFARRRLRERLARKAPTRMRHDEVWELRATLPALIADSLRQMQSMAHGMPCDMTYEQWTGLLGEMAADFEKVATDDDYLPGRGLDLLKEHWLALWD